MKKSDYLELAKEWEVKVHPRMSVEDLRKALAPWANIFIINPESFKTEVDFLLEHNVKGFIFDESVKIKDGTSQITKTTLKFVRHMKKFTCYLVNLPLILHQNITQMQAVDP